MNTSHTFSFSSKLTLFVLIIMAMFAMGTTARAATLTVDSSAGNDGTATPDGSPYLTLHAAVAAANPGDTIEVMPGVHDLTAMLEITEGITVSGSATSSTQIRAVDGSWPSDAKHLIGIYGGTESEPIVLEDLYLNANGKSFGVNTYFNAYGTLDNVTIRNSSGAGLTVNGSTIEATDLTTENNAWGAVNVDPGSGVTTASVFTLHSGNLSEDTKIWSDGDNVTAGSPGVTVNADGYTKLKVEGTEDSYFWVDGSMSGGAFVQNDDNTFYTTIQAAIDAADSGDTVLVFQGTYNENLIINKSLTLWGPNASKNPNTGSRNAEAIIDGGVGFAIKPQATDIEIGGFTIQADATGQAIYNVGAEAADISGLVITNNIIEGGVRGITVESSGNNVVISNNEIQGNERDIHFGDGVWNNLQINGNVLLRPNTDSYAVQMFGPGTGSIDGFEFKDNEVHSGVNIGANITNGTVSGNTFDVDGAVDLALQIVLHNSTVSGNTFDGNEEAACFQIFGSQFGLNPSSGVTISENTFTDCGATLPPFNFAIQLSQGISDISITDNVIENAQEAINTRIGDGWDLTGADITFSGNQVIDTRGAGANNTITGTLNAQANWWGSVSGPNDPTGGDGSIPLINLGAGATILGAVDYSGFCLDEDCDDTSSGTTTPPTPTTTPTTTPGNGNGNGNGNNDDDDDDGPTYGSRGKSRPATPAVPANPGVSPAIPAIPSLNALLNANAQSRVGASAFTFVRDLSVGAQGIDVSELQRRLTQEGVYSGPITGYFGPLTLNAVIKYQAKMGISTTGYVGPLTRASLNANASANVGGAASAQIAALQAQLALLMQQLVVQLELEAKNDN